MNLKRFVATALMTTICIASIDHMSAQAATIKKPKSNQVYVKNNKLYDQATKKLLKKYAQYKGIMYAKGIPLTGTVNGVYFLKGKPGTGIYKKKYYRNGNLASGLYNGKLYRSGVENKGYYIYQEQLYNGPKLNHGIALFGGKLYEDDILYIGYYVYDGLLYKDGRLNTTVVNHNGAWYTGSVITPGWIRTKQLGWIKIDDFGFQIPGAVPPPDLETATNSNLENPYNTATGDTEPPKTSTSEDGMEPPKTSTGEDGMDLNPNIVDDGFINDAEPPLFW